MFKEGDKVRLTCPCHNGMTGVVVATPEGEEADDGDTWIAIDGTSYATKEDPLPTSIDVLELINEGGDATNG